MFIAIEGTDACGKATHSDLLSQWMRETFGQHVTQMAFPDYTTPVGKLIRGHLKELWRCVLSPEGIRSEEGGGYSSTYTNHLVYQSLQAANRAEKSADIAEAIRKGHLVCDRYVASSYAYGLATGIDLNTLLRLGSQGALPDLNILLDLDLSESMSRRPTRRDWIERHKTVLEGAINAYREFWASMAVKEPNRWAVVSARGSISETQTQLRALVSNYANTCRGYSSQSC